MIVCAGLCCVDVVARVPTQPVPGTKVNASEVAVLAGGPAAGAAVAVAALGGSVVLCTALGAHPLADLVRADLAGCGVSVLDAVGSASVPPPVSSIVVSTVDGERTVVGAAAVASSVAATEEMRAAASTAAAVLVDGHHPSLAVELARAATGPVVLDAGSRKPGLDALLPHVAVGAASAAFGSLEPLSGCRVVIRTDGPDPVWWTDGVASGRVPVPAVTAVDTLGAGDVWHGAFTYFAGRDGLADVDRLVRLANDVAATRVRFPGRDWIAAL